jgi:DNA-binding IclR family transcriptional regulator
MSNVQSIERAFAILELVADRADGARVTEIAHTLDLPKSTVSRLLSALEAVQAVERVPDHEGYRIGQGVVKLASHVPYSRHLITVARPYLLELAQATGETVNLCLPDGDQAHYVDQIDSQYHLQIQDWTGYRFPMHCVSNGKLFLAHWPEERLEQYLRRPLQSYTPKTVTDPGQLRQELGRIRKQGFAWATGESEAELAGLAAPIRDGDGHLVASVCVGGPAFRFPPAGKAEEMEQLVVTIGQQISGHLSDLFE